jgi:predicted secreted protein
MRQDIHVKVGETFEIPLEGSAGTGFRWEVDPLAAAAPHVKLLKESRAAVSTAPGGKTVQRFQFQALAPGRLDLTFRYRRAWEDAAAGTVQTVAVQIDAPPKSGEGS